MKIKFLILFLILSPVCLIAQDYEKEGDALFAQAQYGQALKKYEAAEVIAEIDGKDVPSQLNAKKTKAKKCSELLPKAHAAEKAGRYSEAARCYSDLYANHPLASYQSKANAMKQKVEQERITKGIAEKAGTFSVSSTKKVRFSKGNLQFNATLGTHRCADGTTKKGTWRFAENQYDTIGLSQKNRSSSYSGWIDTFEWGTSGWNSGAKSYQPWSISAVPFDYYPGNDQNADLTYTYAYADWGVYNAISNGGNVPNKWRVLSADEWDYLLNKRINHEKLCAAATINGVKGKIILPDDYVFPNGIAFVGFTTDSNDNQYSNSEWQIMEKNGAVFLPRGVGWSTNKGNTRWQKLCGLYWSSTHQNAHAAFGIVTYTHSIYKGRWRCDSGHVRLVQDVK